MPTSRSKQPSNAPKSATTPKRSSERKRRSTNTAPAVEESVARPPVESSRDVSLTAVPSDEELSAFLTQLKQSHRFSLATATHPSDEHDHTNGDTVRTSTANSESTPLTATTQRSRRSKRSAPATRQTQRRQASPSTSGLEPQPLSEAPQGVEVTKSESVASGTPDDDPSVHSRRRRNRRRNMSEPSQHAARAQRNADTPDKQRPAKAHHKAEHTAEHLQTSRSASRKHTRRTFVVRDLYSMPEIPDDCIPIIEHVEHVLTTELSVEPGSTILIAISGGVDSVVLLDILFILSFEHGYQLHLAHINHKLRDAEADRDEAFVRRLAKRYDLPCHVTHVETRPFARKHHLSIEEAARELRYRFLRQMCGTIHAQYCAVAHTADDTAETLLLNLVRGSGLTGLAAIPPKRPLTKKAMLIRPLLGITRQEIVRYATARTLEWEEDSTNADPSYTRNRIRHQVLPVLKEQLNPRIVETLARTAELLRQADGFIESFIESTFLEIATIRDGRVELNRNALSQMHQFLQGELIERALSELTDRRTLPQAAVERVRRLLTAETGTRQSVAGTITAIADRTHLVLSDESTLHTVYLPLFKLGTYQIGRVTITLEEIDRNDVRLGANPNIEYFDYDKLPYRLFLRTWQAGDRFAPIGMDGRQVLVADYLTNAKLSDYDRRTAVVLATATDIVWLCGYRMSEHYKLSNDTRRIIRATFQRT